MALKMTLLRIVYCYMTGLSDIILWAGMSENWFKYKSSISNHSDQIQATIVSHSNHRISSMSSSIISSTTTAARALVVPFTSPQSELVRKNFVVLDAQGSREQLHPQRAGTPLQEWWPCRPCDQEWWPCLQPLCLQTQAEWLRNNHHGLAWDSGSFSYTSVMQFVQQNTRDIVILVKGIEKTIWTEEFMLEGVYRPLNVIHVEEHGIPNLKRLQCFYPHIRTCDHVHSGVCALQNTLLIRNHLLKMCAPDMI